MKQKHYLFFNMWFTTCPCRSSIFIHLHFFIREKKANLLYWIDCFNCLISWGKSWLTPSNYILTGAILLVFFNGFIKHMWLFQVNNIWVLLFVTVSNEQGEVLLFHIKRNNIYPLACHSLCVDLQVFYVRPLLFIYKGEKAILLYWTYCFICLMISWGKIWIDLFPQAISKLVQYC